MTVKKSMTMRRRRGIISTLSLSLLFLSFFLSFFLHLGFGLIGTLIKQVLSEMFDLFPDRVFHIGTDELIPHEKYSESVCTLKNLASQGFDYI